MLDEGLAVVFVAGESCVQAVSETTSAAAPAAAAREVRVRAVSGFMIVLECLVQRAGVRVRCSDAIPPTRSST